MALPDARSCQIYCLSYPWAPCGVSVFFVIVVFVVVLDRFGICLFLLSGVSRMCLVYFMYVVDLCLDMLGIRYVFAGVVGYVWYMLYIC